MRHTFQKLKQLSAILLLVTLFPLSSVSGQAQTGYRLIATDTLTTGVVHTHYKGMMDSLSIHVVHVDLTQPKLHIGVARANNHLIGRQKTSEIARDRTSPFDSVLVAINADFFNISTGENENNQVINGTIVRGIPVTDSPYDTFDNIHSQFALTISGIPLIERFQFDGFILHSGNSVKIDAVNSAIDSARVILYNQYFGNFSPDSLPEPHGTNFILHAVKSHSDTTWYSVERKTRKGHQPIPSGGAVLYTAESSSKILEHYSDGEPIAVVLRFIPAGGSIRSLTGGWPRIVQNGVSIAARVDSLEGTFPEFSKDRHPRTGVGFSKDSTTVYFLTVDGRQESSSGMSLEEFADFMLSMGVHQGLNLDGGGSTTLVIGGQVVNSPSDETGERPVGNSLLLYLKR